MNAVDAHYLRSLSINVYAEEKERDRNAIPLSGERISAPNT